MIAYVYLLASKRKGTLYIGCTTNLVKRIWEHKNKLKGGFTAKYNVNKLVYYETYDRIVDAIARERSLKNWRREWKIKLIEKHNYQWKDLYDEVI